MKTEARRIVCELIATRGVTINGEAAAQLEDAIAAALARAVAEKREEALALLRRYRDADNEDVLTGVDEDTDAFFAALRAPKGGPDASSPLA